MEKLSDEKLVALVQRKLDWYEPQSVRRVEIPKGTDPTKKRPLGIPTILDRLIQQCVLQVLEPICEARFHDHSYGFRPNRNQEHAIALVYKNIQLSHYYFVVDIDIKGFFDNVNHGKLMRNPIPYRSAAYNDNRISLYCAQFGKCAVMGEMLTISDIHCHHKRPKHLGGTDEYKNLIIVCEDVHRLIYATTPGTIRKYLDKLNLDPEQLKKLNKFRSLANVESCLQFDAV